MKYDIFISYSRQDKGFVQQLTNCLDAYGYTLSVDNEGICSGDNFAQRIFDAIENSNLVLCVLSKSCLDSKWVVNEIAIAESLEKRIISVNIDGSILTGSLRIYLGRIPQLRVNEDDDLEKEILPAIGRLINRPNRKVIITEDKEVNSSSANERRQTTDDYIPKKIDVDIFISYRRVDGRDWARNVMQALKINGYPKVFFDYNSLRDGVFNTQILDAIYSCNDFVLIISPLSLKRCANDGDWVSREIREAIKYKKKIIPVVIEDTFLGWPDDFPKDMYPIKEIQFSKLMTDEFFEDSIEKLTKRLSTKAAENVDLSQLTEKSTSFLNATVYTYKVKVSEDCDLYLDDEFIQTLTAKTLTRISLPQGEYLRKVVSRSTNAESEEILVLDRDKAEIINLPPARKKSIFRR